MAFSYKWLTLSFIIASCSLQCMSAGFNSGSSSGRLTSSNLRRKNTQTEKDGAAVKTSNSRTTARSTTTDQTPQTSTVKNKHMEVHDSPSWASKTGRETVNGVEYYYFIDPENDGAVLENTRQCAVNIMDERTSLVLPQSLGGVPLIGLGSGSCQNLVDVEKIKLPSSLRHIGSRAFEGCSSLKSIVLPKCLNRVCAEAFKDCEHLTTINLTKDIHIDYGAFEDWTGLEKIVLPDGLKQSLPSFSGCKALRTILLPKRIESDGINQMWMCFRNCESLESIEIPVGFDQISSGAFENCKKLVSVTLPDTVKKIGFHAFKGCSSLKKIELPYKISRIETAVFAKCSSLESIVIPENVEVIKDVAFSECVSLKEVVLSASVKRLDEDAFVDCNNIKTFKIHASIKEQVLNAKTGHLYDSKRFKDTPETKIELIND